MLDRADASKEAQDQPAEKMAREAIEEARMVLPGIQALFGFQLMAVFSQRFNELDHGEQALHFIAVLLIAESIGFIMTPAAYHGGSPICLGILRTARLAPGRDCYAATGCSPLP